MKKVVFSIEMDENGTIRAGLHGDAADIIDAVSTVLSRSEDHKNIVKAAFVMSEVSNLVSKGKEASNE